AVVFSLPATASAQTVIIVNGGGGGPGWGPGWGPPRWSAGWGPGWGPGWAPRPRLYAAAWGPRWGWGPRWRGGCWSRWCGRCPKMDGPTYCRTSFLAEAAAGCSSGLNAAPPRDERPERRSIPRTGERPDRQTQARPLPFLRQ